MRWLTLARMTRAASTPAKGCWTALRSPLRSPKGRALAGSWLATPRAHRVVVAPHQQQGSHGTLLANVARRGTRARVGAGFADPRRLGSDWPGFAGAATAN